MSQVRPGLLIAILVFAVFAAYAFLAPTVYRTSALLVVDSAAGASLANMPEPLEAARRLSEAVLDRKTLEKLSRERAGSAATDVQAQAQASSSVRRGLEIDTSDGHAFSIGYRDTDGARAQSACNLLARHAAELAPTVLVDRSAERAAELKRQQQTQELAAFLALHPQVAAEAPPPGDKSLETDPALSAFHAEKANLDRRILELESGIVSDNPYVDPKDSDLGLLKRRLVEINTALTARRQAFDVKPTGSPLSAELRAEWRRLLDAVSQSSADAGGQPRATLRARVLQEAPLPGSPIEPNRRLLLFFGVVFGVGLGTAFTLAMRTQQQRRSKSSRPAMPLPSQGGVTVHLPAAPPLPSGLGPAVPVTQPQPRSNPAPPIVPIPQRAISSAPPGPIDNQVKHHSSRPPARRFASTLVLPPAENPSAAEDTTPDPVLASANQAWEQQIRAHDVPGFAVVKAPSEPPPPATSSSVPPPIFPPKPVSSAPPPAANTQRATSRPPNQMKVTQPLGSFLPDGVWTDPAKGLQVRAMPSQGPRSPSRSSSPAPASQYSYVSTAPPASTSLASTSASPASSAAAPRANPVRVQEVSKGWRPDPTLTPQVQRPLCEQLYPYAVENCFVLAVVAVPEAVNSKSRVAAELALCLAESGHPRILLLEGDLQRPWVQRMIGIDMPISTGFSQQMNARTQGSHETRWTVLGCTKTLHVLAEGMMRSPGLLLSKHFADCLKELRTYYDFIVIDGPSASLDVDSGALNAVTDGIVTVCPTKGSPALAHMQTLFAKKRFSAFAPG